MMQFHGLLKLTTITNNTNDASVDTKTRIIAVNKAYYFLQNIFWSKQIHQNKIRLYKPLIRPVLCYGSVSWTLT